MHFGERAVEQLATCSPILRYLAVPGLESRQRPGAEWFIDPSGHPGEAPQTVEKSSHYRLLQPMVMIA